MLGESIILTRHSAAFSELYNLYNYSTIILLMVGFTKLVRFHEATCSVPKVGITDNLHVQLREIGKQYSMASS